ncbi:nicotinate phosphoribosyltransferase [Microvirga terricola]|uniref:Nicotinate phosphoribosyltransferase n=1 Tax=Microvirga terricola TaxID=2719797 RepID=A0ABX0V5N4_9HYPH|nr:nicotinate phosphoribosyltransferase [Microvirga terricola]NIX75037.1 nicotinate phosphoribosyltransferase [Microvirga terricola]
MQTSHQDVRGGSSASLFVDLYEMTMLHAYRECGMNGVAAFDLFVRTLPPERNFLIACGVNCLLDQLENLAFSDRDIGYLSTLGLFPQEFLENLRSFRFTGDIFALEEGTPFFANEPILEVIAPIGEAQIIETLVLNQVGLQTLLASKAARVVEAAKGRPVVDFGGRRAQGLDAAIKGARAFFIAGISATSNLEAGRQYGIPVVGTMAHSFIEACATEIEAFSSFATVFPTTTLLVDTYDTLEGVSRVVDLARELGPDCKIHGIRLDSGDLVSLSQQARSILDGAGLHHLQIFVSGGLNESEISRLLAADVPIDAFGVGTDMSVSMDLPAFDIAYKIVEYEGVGRMKFSPRKRTLPGRKQVFRHYAGGMAESDVIARLDSRQSEGTALLKPVMLGGHRLGPSPPISDIKNRTSRMLSELPRALRTVAPAMTPYPVIIDEELQDYEREIAARVATL